MQNYLKAYKLITVRLPILIALYTAVFVPFIVWYVQYFEQPAWGYVTHTNHSVPVIVPGYGDLASFS
jgi:hypothetical protein